MSAVLQLYSNLEKRTNWKYNWEETHTYQKMKLADLIIIGIGFVVVGLLIYVIMLIRTDGAVCVDNPISYFENMKNVSCVCQKLDWLQP